MLFVAAACTEQGTEPDTPPVTPPEIEEPVEPESYTIMYFACGGGTLDNGIEIVLRSAELVGCRDNIKVTGSVKWTSRRTSNIASGDGGVYRFMLDSNENSELRFRQVGDKEYPLYDPENIADFVAWSKSVAPADNYILILAGHGNGWHPGVGLIATRGTLRDTDTKRYISLGELDEGLALADTHFKMIMFNSCLMNTMEYLTALSDDADYIFAPNHVSILLGSELSFLLTSLGDMEEPGDEAFIAAMENYYTDIADLMMLYSEDESSLDIILTDTRRIEAINKAIKRLTDAIVALYEEEANIGAEAMEQKYGGSIATLEASLSQSYNFLTTHLDDEEIAETEYMRQSFTCDLADVATRAAVAIDSPELVTAANDVISRCWEAQKIYYAQGLWDIEKVSYAITLTNSQRWISYGYDRGGYCETLFDQTTGWSRFLSINTIELRY